MHFLTRFGDAVVDAVLLPDTQVACSQEFFSPIALHAHSGDSVHRLPVEFEFRVATLLSTELRCGRMPVFAQPVVLVVVE